MPLILPSQLEADATVPQCLDNQYVSDNIFDYLLKSGATYEDKNVQQMRTEEIQTEFIRSLVYSSQVVINRAFMRNNEYLYKNYQRHRKEDFHAFCGLLRQKAVIPFLFSESSLGQEAAFDKRKEGDVAIKDLVEEIGDQEITCVRLAMDDEKNKKNTTILASRFATNIASLGYLDDLRRNAMAVELFGEKQHLHENEGWGKFSSALDDLSDYAHKMGKQKRSEGFLTRNDIYRDFLIDSTAHEGIDTAITLGKFRKPDSQNPFVLELKKLIDLIYNTNLPDFLDRYTFTPANLPSRTALQDHPDNATQEQAELNKIVTDKDLLTHIRRTFMARSQAAMTLPLLRKLSMADVLAIRSLPEWEAFKTSQTKILKDPLHCLDLFAEFETSFDSFQRALSAWYNGKYKHQETEAQYERYVSFVTVGIGVAGVILFAHGGESGHSLAGEAFRSGLDHLSELIPKRVKGYTAKLMVGVYDKGKHQLDHERSYSLEIMRTNEELMREDILDLIHQVAKSAKELPEEEQELVADQGK